MAKFQHARIRKTLDLSPYERERESKRERQRERERERERERTRERERENNISEGKAKQNAGGGKVHMSCKRKLKSDTCPTGFVAAPR